MPEPSAPFLTESRIRLFLAVLLAALTLALYGRTVGYGFTKLDDVQYVVDNPHVNTGLSAANIRWAFTTAYEHWWLPLLWISYMADTSLFGPGPAGHHATNLLLHTANVLLLFWILFCMTGAKGRSFFVAAFFALHPLQVESVAWIAERKDVLSGLFFFLALLAYVRHAERPSASRLGLVHLWMLLGLLSKSMLVILPPLLLLLDFWPLRRAGDPWRRESWPRWRTLLAEKSGLFALAIAFAALNLHTHSATVVNRDGITALDRLGMVFPNYWHYLARIAWPAHLSSIYPPNDAVHWPLSLAAAAGLLLLTGWAVVHRRHQPFWVVGWLWFLVGLVPVIRGVRFDAMLAYADRYTYLPGIGVAIAAVWGAAALLDRRPRMRPVEIALGLALLAACFARSSRRLPAWQDSFQTLSELIDYTPRHFEANRDFGLALLERDRAEDALVYLARAAAANPRDTQTPAARADALLRFGRTQQAADYLQQVLAERAPDDPALNNLLGYAWLGLDRADLAIAPLRKATRAHPRHLGWRVELVRALFETGDESAALDEIRRLQREGHRGIQSFDDLIPHYVTWWTEGENTHAWPFFERALQRRPDHVLLLNAAAWLLATDPAPPAPPAEALRLARRAVELAPGPHPGLLDTLAAALAANGQFDEARQTAQQALDLALRDRNAELAARLERRLAAYRQYQPWREGPAP
jgi:protein O-mannosyl-transferase